MGQSEKSIQNFEDLEAWKKAIELAVEIYKVTNTYPKSELFSLVNQMRRASSSISANLAEGCGRYNYKEKLQFYRIANGSLLEVKSFCYLSEKLGYISIAQLQELLSLILSSQKLISGLIRGVKVAHES